MFTNTLTPDTLRAIRTVAQIPAIANAYLAGGTALSLQIGHRISVDLDFFTLHIFDENVLLMDLTGKIKTFVKQQTAWRTILGLVENTKFSIFYYQYPLISPLTDFEGIKLANLEDISAMKLHAIEDRGIKRDFIDLFFLSQKFSLDQMLGFYQKKYNCLTERKYHILRALAYFDDAEKADEPKMLLPVDWEEVKNFFRAEVKRLWADLEKTF